MSQPLPSDPAPAPDRVIGVYLEHFDLLRFIAMQKFRVPLTEAENLVQEVFVAYLRHYERIGNDRAWLVAAVCNASRAWWRRENRPPFARQLVTEAAVSDMAASRADARALFARLPPRCRKLLRLRFYDGCSPRELAGHYGTTEGYAKVMLHRCMKTARALLRGRRA
ncbi:MAG TPA: sigma-70 family RNA polymerase sigma factor [Thermoanaerobaculia bacterium]|nr:sigma-70 family RNA polymerase sigma factor [Thermoanaerobaculia bacterium]